jgi:hypothetical protein
MKNQWIQHLERASPEKRERGTSFVKMLHVLARDGGKRKGSHFHMKCSSQLSRSKVSEKNKQHTPACAELCRWTAESQLGYDTGIDSPGDDFVQLLKSGNGQMMLKYNVTGEEVFEIDVGSVEEAEKVISEDNMTTSILYPGNPEFQWSKK